MDDMADLQDQRPGGKNREKNRRVFFMFLFTSGKKIQKRIKLPMPNIERNKTAKQKTGSTWSRFLRMKEMNELLAGGTVDGATDDELAAVRFVGFCRLKNCDFCVILKSLFGMRNPNLTFIFLRLT